MAQDSKGSQTPKANISSGTVRLSQSEIDSLRQHKRDLTAAAQARLAAKSPPK